MNLTKPDRYTDVEWQLAGDILRVRRQGGRLALREEALDKVCGSTERALRVLSARSRMERRLDSLLEPRWCGEFDLSPVPPPVAVHRPQVSSGLRTPAGRTARQKAGARTELILATVAVGIVMFIPLLVALRTVWGPK